MKQKKTVEDLLQLIATLRGENGCPWDRKQTVQSMSVYLQEEMHELLEAIETENSREICKELGDVLFQLMFIVELYREAGQFDFQDVIYHNIEKMVRRHPHVFGNLQVNSIADVKKNWNAIKRLEKQEEILSDVYLSVLDSVPAKLPPLLRAYRISERAAAAGFDWKDMTGVMHKVEEEWDEFRQAVANRKSDEIAEEFGDLLFTLINVARFAAIHPETALTDAVHKFEKRYRAMEKQLFEAGQTLQDLSRKEVDALWETVKQIQKKQNGKTEGS
jgi:MazG family protein